MALVSVVGVLRPTTRAMIPEEAYRFRVLFALTKICAPMVVPLTRADCHPSRVGSGIHARFPAHGTLHRGRRRNRSDRTCHAQWYPLFPAVLLLDLADYCRTCSPVFPVVIGCESSCICLSWTPLKAISSPVSANVSESCMSRYPKSVVVLRSFSIDPSQCE